MFRCYYVVVVVVVVVEHAHVVTCLCLQATSPADLA